MSSSRANAHSAQPLNAWVEYDLCLPVRLIDPDAPPGEYQLEIGWVHPATGQRHGLGLVQSPDEVYASHLDSLLISGIGLH
jgi:hypothetical protein